MELTIAILLLLATGALSWLRADFRRPFLWGGLCGLPFLAMQIILAGSFWSLGYSRADAVETAAALFVIGAVFGALGAVLYDRWLGRWLTPQATKERNKLYWLTFGLVVALALIICGQPVIFSIIIGLLADAIILPIVGRHLLWDAWLSAWGWAAWYVLMDLLFGVRAAGDTSQVIFGGQVLNVTWGTVPLAELIVIAGMGALIGPIYAATKFRRHPNHQRVRHASTVKINVGLVLAIALLGVCGWTANEFMLAPKTSSVYPASGAENVSRWAQVIIKFNRPVDRDSLQISVLPETDGYWKFSDPTTGEHGWRTAQYFFQETLLPDTDYEVLVSGVKSVSGVAGEDVKINFHTAALPDVVGSDHGPNQKSDPCGQINALLTDEYDGTVEFTAKMDPEQPVNVAVERGSKNVTMTLAKCLSEKTTYHLSIYRRLLVRDVTTDEVTAIGDYILVYETEFSVNPSSAQGQSKSYVLGAVDAKSIKVIRPRKILSVAMDYQDQALSCEAAALKMALAGVGVKVSEKKIMAKVGYDRTPHKGSVWGDPDKAFVGNISGRQCSTGYGVHWVPIARAAKTWAKAEAFTKGNVAKLVREINAGNPVVIWGVMGRYYQVSWKTPNGKKITTWKGEHARTVIGYYGSSSNPTSFIINDPIVGRITWSVKTLKANWAKFNYSGVVVRKS